MNWVDIHFPTDFKKIQTDVLMVYGSSFPANCGRIETFITNSEWDKFNLCKNQAQIKTRINCRATLRLLIANLLKSHPKLIVFRENKFGKPFIEQKGIFFNVSHTNNAFLIVISKAGRIGVDIEVLNGHENMECIMEYAFSKNEKAEASDQAGFLETWTCKESLLKALGIGLVNRMHRIDTISMINKLGLNRLTFICPGFETASIVSKAHLVNVTAWVV
jgi:phosphopantetheinyl transferase